MNIRKWMWICLFVDNETPRCICILTIFSIRPRELSISGSEPQEHLADSFVVVVRACVRASVRPCMRLRIPSHADAASLNRLVLMYTFVFSRVEFERINPSDPLSDFVHSNDRTLNAAERCHTRQKVASKCPREVAMNHALFFLTVALCRSHQHVSGLSLHVISHLKNHEM
jgi:hypothetical protein